MNSLSKHSATLCAGVCFIVIAFFYNATTAVAAGPTVGFTVKGKVLVLKGEHAEISVGSDDSVELQQQFNIYRGKKFIGRLQITRVTPDRSAGLILKKWRQTFIKVGDTVETVK